MNSKAATRQAILRAADKLFAQFGPVKTSVADIARDLGMSSTNIYNFFASRDAILEAVGEAQLSGLQRQIVADIAPVDDPWTRLSILFLSTAQHLRVHLQNEKDILQLQALERRYRWKFICAFDQFLRHTAESTLRDGIAAGSLRKLDPAAATCALFDCMMSALDPLIILKFDCAEHEARVRAQLALLESAFCLPAPDPSPRLIFPPILPRPCVACVERNLASCPISCASRCH